MVDPYDAFTMMYYILDAAADEMPGTDVVIWASEANPFLFKDGGSADPAVWTEFKETWDKKFGPDKRVGDDACRAFIRDHLASLSPDCLKAFDLVVDDDHWAEDLDAVKSQNEARRDTKKD